MWGGCFWSSQQLVVRCVVQWQAAGTASLTSLWWDEPSSPPGSKLVRYAKTICRLGSAQAMQQLLPL